MSMQHDKITINGHQVELKKRLTVTEFSVLGVLNMHFGEFVGNQYLAEKCAPSDRSYLYDWTARVHVCAINKALLYTGFKVYNRRARGYQLSAESDL